MSSVIDAMEQEPLCDYSKQIEYVVLDKTGDSKHIWDKDNADEVEAARQMFDTFKKKGYTAYHVKGKNGEKDEVMTRFDPTAERVIFAPRAVGG